MSKWPADRPVACQWPWLSVAFVRDSPVSRFLIVTATSARGDPACDFTTPEILASVCARAAAGTMKRSDRTTKASKRALTGSLRAYSLVGFEGRANNGDELRIYTTFLAKSKRFDALGGLKGWRGGEFTFEWYGPRSELEVGDYRRTIITSVDFTRAATVWP